MVLVNLGTLQLFGLNMTFTGCSACLMLELTSFLFALTLPFSVVFSILWLWVVPLWLLAVPHLVIMAQLPLVGCFPLALCLFSPWVWMLI